MNDIEEFLKDIVINTALDNKWTDILKSLSDKNYSVVADEMVTGLNYIPLRLKEWTILDSEGYICGIDIAMDI